MTDRSDHLIERAAALLRTAKAGHVVDARAATPADQTGGGTGKPVSPRPVINPNRTQNPAWQQKPSPTSGKAIPQAQRQPGTLMRGGSVAELRSLATQGVIELSRLERAGLMVARSGRTRTSEEYRIIMGRVLRALHEDEEGEPLPQSAGAPNVVLVTSARPGEGKSFTALNLGGSIAQNAGESVLLVDVDAKKNSLTDLLGLTNRPGFLDMATKPNLEPEGLIVPTELANLSILPLGNRTGDRTGAMVETVGEGRRLAPTVLRLANRFPRSLIILDAPPCLSTSDPHTLAPAVGQVLLVVEAERTQRSEIEAAVDLVKTCPNITTLLNKVRMNTSYTFGSYDYFGSYS